MFTIFYILIILSYLQKSKRPGFHILVSYILLITQDLIKKNKQTENTFVDIVKYETCAKFQQKILNPMAVGARHSFRFYRQVT